MSETQSENTTLTLQELRKNRKKLKKEAKRAEKEKAREKKIMELKIGPKDNRVTIISRELASSIIDSNISSKISNNSLEIKDEDFPELGQTPRPKQTSTNNINKVEQQIENNSSSSLFANKPRKSAPLKVNIMEILTKPEIPISTIPKVKETNVQQYDGNILDSSLPERKRGKHNEIPKKKKLTKLKSAILSEKGESENSKIEYAGIHSPQFETYCDNCITNELNESVNTLLSNIVKFQEKLYHRDPIKGVSKRRYVTGLREIKKYLKLNKLELLIIAPNIKIPVENGTLDSTIHDLIALANTNDIPYVFALSRRILGRITIKHIAVSSVGILDHSGSEEAFKSVLEKLQIAKNLYRDYQLSLQKTQEKSTEKMTENLIQALK